MSWNCRLIEFTRETSGATLQIGDMFFAPTAEQLAADEALPEDQRVGWDWPAWICEPHKLSDYYRQHNSHRQPLLVWLPGRSLFCVDSACWHTPTLGGKIEYYGGWQVTGEAPLITVSPSINMVGSYHGWLQNGVVSDDCEGRQYDPLTGKHIR